MKNTILKSTLVLSLCFGFILRGQSQTPKTAIEKPNKSTTKKGIKKIVKVEDIKNADKGFNPVLSMPVLTFDTKFHDFGTIKKGEITPVFIYNFTNTGNAPLHIDQVSGCDCSEFDWTRTAVAPNEKGFVSIKFNSNKAEPEEIKKKLEKYLDVILKQTHPKTGYVLMESVKFNVFIAD